MPDRTQASDGLSAAGKCGKFLEGLGVFSAIDLAPRRAIDAEQDCRPPPELGKLKNRNQTSQAKGCARHGARAKSC
ncbi:hypothetical protein AY599_00515 [Leptolyngbya valderiana BDU 20041]|nr:hypothetical protein AY599_00515 [Leptolyngbya valderiana BDU 20041]